MPLRLIFAVEEHPASQATANNNAMFNFIMPLRIPHRAKRLKIILTQNAQLISGYRRRERGLSHLVVSRPDYRVLKTPCGHWRWRC